jgi:hypothetical protein
MTYFGLWRLPGKMASTVAHRHEAQRTARGGAVGHLGYDLGQRMAHIGGCNTVLGQQFGLKRKDAQHVVYAALNFLHSVGAPGPNRGADKVHGFDALLAQCGLEVEVEIRGIDANEDASGGSCQQALFEQLIANRPEFRDSDVAPPS